MLPLLRALGFGAGLAFVVYIATVSAQTNPIIGTWELNLGKSKFNPGPPPKSLTFIYEVAGQGVKYSAKGVDVEGKPASLQSTYNPDGKDYPIAGSPDYDTMAVKRIDPYNSEVTLMKAGRVVQTATRVNSKDGRVLTLTVKGMNAKGQTINNVLVFDKR